MFAWVPVPRERSSSPAGTRRARVADSLERRDYGHPNFVAPWMRRTIPTVAMLALSAVMTDGAQTPAGWTRTVVEKGDVRLDRLCSTPLAAASRAAVGASAGRGRGASAFVVAILRERPCR